MPMPVYTWTTQKDTFSEDQQKALAKLVTDTHCSVTGAPRNFVRVIFDTYIDGSSFSGGVRSATVFLQCRIRAGRSMEAKHTIMKQLNDAAVTIGKISRDELVIILEEIAPGHGMEFGEILPEATPEKEKQWLEAHGR
jgi:phenylpyruvate tautomerase PptA (4-oxalocrotonate tautomerase family)